MTGGSKSVSYYVSFGSQQDAGIFKNSPTKFKRYNLKANFDAKINEYLTLGLNVNGIQENKNYPSTDAAFNLDGAIKSLPTSPALLSKWIAWTGYRLWAESCDNRNRPNGF